MSQMNVNPSLVSKIFANFDKQETQDLLEAMVVELKQDLRKHAYKKVVDDSAIEMLIGNIQDPSFWDQLHILLNNFYFDF